MTGVSISNMLYLSKEKSSWPICRLYHISIKLYTSPIKGVSFLISRQIWEISKKISPIINAQIKIPAGLSKSDPVTYSVSVNFKKSMFLRGLACRPPIRYCIVL